MKSSNLFRYFFLAGGVIFIAGVLIFTSLPLSKATSSLNKVVKKEAISGMGCLFNSERLKKETVFTYDQEENKTNLSMLSRYSLEEYLPEIGNQGDVGSCVGWATTYYGFTIIKRLEHGKDYPVFSPLSVFNRFSYFKGFNPCDNGAYIDECLSLLVSKGCPFEKDYDKPNCSVDPTRKRFNDCLFNFERLQHNNATQIKLALANNNPVIIGMNVFSGGKGNNLNSRFLDSNGVVKMDNFRSNKHRVGGHALCIVGYDDEVGGGAFKIANSWGKDWGKNGFFWLRYSDLEVVRCAYALIANEKVVSVKSKFKTKNLAITNYNKKNMYVCLGYETESGVKTKGWYLIQAGQTRWIGVENRTSNEIYYMLMNENGNLFQAHSNNFQYPANPSRSFDYNNKQDADVYNYFKIEPLNKKKTQYCKISGSSIPKLLE
jgi:C1A family cysteine protease